MIRVRPPLSAPPAERPIFTRTASISLAAHVFVVMPWLFNWGGVFGRGAMPDAPPPQIEVELVSQAETTQGAPPVEPAEGEPTPPQATATPDAGAPEPRQATAPAPPAPPPPPLPPIDYAAVPMPPPPQHHRGRRPDAPPVTRAAAQAPATEVNLGNGDRTTPALTVTGDNIVPATPDSLYRNKPPGYPNEAARRHEQGKVALIIHVTPDGTASGVDIVASSGSPSLDRAAQMALARWHFRPRIENGLAVAADFTMTVQFNLGEP